jgi:hypothetical protein
MERRNKERRRKKNKNKNKNLNEFRHFFLKKKEKFLLVLAGFVF